MGGAIANGYKKLNENQKITFRLEKIITEDPVYNLTQFFNAGHCLKI